MTEETLLSKAVKELNEKDAQGSVGKIKNLIKLIDGNDKKIELYQKSNKELKKEITKLVTDGGLDVSKYMLSE